MIEQPSRAFHFDAVGGGVARTDQFYGIDVGQYNTWRVRASFSETPHVFTSTYRLAVERRRHGHARTDRADGRRHDQRQHDAGRHAVGHHVGVPERSLARPVRRAGRELDLMLPANWKAFASYSRERRDGSRPFGAVFGGGGGGGNLEIPELIDDSTQNILAGLQFAGTQTNLTVQASASMFRNDIDTLMFENPLFIQTNTIAGVAPTTFTQGQFDLYPSNNYFNFRTEVAHKLPDFFRSRVTGVIAFGRIAPGRRADSVGDRATDGRHDQRRVDDRHVEHDRGAQPDVCRSADRYAAGRCQHRS